MWDVHRAGQRCLLCEHTHNPHHNLISNMFLRGCLWLQKVTGGILSTDADHRPWYCCCAENACRGSELVVHAMATCSDGCRDADLSGSTETDARNSCISRATSFGVATVSTSNHHSFSRGFSDRLRVFPGQSGVHILWKS